MLAGLLVAFGLAGDTTASDAHRAFFAEPLSGRKVTHYRVDLPVSLNQRDTFSIPDDCSKVMRAIDGGATYKGNIVDRGLWKKTESDCRYHDFLNGHPQRVVEDYVSDYDFRNAYIPDLPLHQGCADKGPGQDPSACNPTSTNKLGMLSHFPIATLSAEAPDRADRIPCRLRNGRFRGYVTVNRQGVECSTDASASGVRLIAVDFADINGDRILDAVLRFIPIGSSNTRARLVLPLTKLEPSAAFSIPGPAISQSADQR